MRKISLFILILVFSLAMAGVAGAETKEPTNVNEALSIANDELKDKTDGDDYFYSTNKNNKPINNSLWESRRLFVYGQPYGMDPATGNNRYLGETMPGEAYTNTLFRHDAWEGGTINERKWFPEPWRDPEVKSYLQRNGEQPLDWVNPFNNNPEYLSSIKRGIKEYFPAGQTMIYFKDDGTEWQQFIHVLQPPTSYVYGMGRMWHQKADGSIWYLTIPMAPLIEPPIPDLSVALEVEKFENVKPGDKLTSTVTYTLNKDHPNPEKAWLRLHHVVGNQEFAITLEPINSATPLDSNGYVVMQPGEPQTYRYTMTAQNVPTKVLARINPVDTYQDKDWSNNRDEAPVLVPAYDAAVEVFSDTGDNYDIVKGESQRISFTIFTYRNDELGGTIPVKLTLTGPGGTQVQQFAVGNSHVEKRYTFNVTKGGTYTVRAEAWPSDGSWNDIKPENNVAAARIVIEEITVPGADGDIGVTLGGKD